MPKRNDKTITTIRRTVTFHPAVLQLANELCVIRTHAKKTGVPMGRIVDQQFNPSQP